MQQLSKDPGKLRLGGENRPLTILFSDIRGFTSISEQLEAEALTRLMNRFLTPMSHEILNRRGTIDKYIGDAIMAFWNAPLDDAEHAVHGCEAACALHRLLDPLNETLGAEAAAEGRPYQPLRAGVGLNTGTCVVGNVGSDVRFDYSVIGDTVNLASRLEGLTKQYGVAILISESVRAAAPEFATLEADLVRVKGRNEPVRIHAVLGEPAVAQSPEFLELAANHGRMLEAYRAMRWGEARQALESCRQAPCDTYTLESNGLTGLYDVFEERIAQFEQEPPASPWDGVFTATSK